MLFTCPTLTQIKCLFQEKCRRRYRLFRNDLFLHHTLKHRAPTAVIMSCSSMLVSSEAPIFSTIKATHISTDNQSLASILSSSVSVLYLALCERLCSTWLPAQVCICCASERVLLVIRMCTVCLCVYVCVKSRLWECPFIDELEEGEKREFSRSPGAPSEHCLSAMVLSAGRGRNVHTQKHSDLKLMPAYQS